MRSNSQLRRRFDVLLSIIGEEKSLRRLAGSRDRDIVDPAVGFHRTDFMREDLVVEVIQNAIVPGDKVRMGFVGIGNEDQRIAGLQACQKFSGTIRSGRKTADQASWNSSILISSLPCSRRYRW